MVVVTQERGQALLPDLELLVVDRVNGLKGFLATSALSQIEKLQVGKAGLPPLLSCVEFNPCKTIQ